MRTKFIPEDKMNKKARIAINNSRRGTWGPLNPVTRRSENPKAYNRNREKKGRNHE